MRKPFTNGYVKWKNVFSKKLMEVREAGVAGVDGDFLPLRNAAKEWHSLLCGQISRAGH